MRAVTLGRAVDRWQGLRWADVWDTVKRAVALSLCAVQPHLAIHYAAAADGTTAAEAAQRLACGGDLGDGEEAVVATADSR